MKLNFKAQRSEGRRGEYDGPITGGIALFVDPESAANYRFPQHLSPAVLDYLNQQLQTTAEKLEGDATEYQLVSVNQLKNGGRVGNYRKPVDFESMLAGIPTSDMEPRERDR